MKSCKLYVITDVNIQKKYSHVELSEILCKNGVKLIQFRDKLMNTKELFQTAKKMKIICEKYKAKLIINDRVDIAMLSGADGVHLGKDDMSVKDVRKLLGKNKIIGGTAHSLKEAIDAEKDGADYVGYGHIFPTQTKLKSDKPKGISKLKEVVDKVSIAVYAIGGIIHSNIEEVLSTGVYGVAVSGGIINTKNVKSSVRNFLRILNES